MTLNPTIRGDLTTLDVSTLRIKRRILCERLDDLESGRRYAGVRGWCGRTEGSYKIEHGQLEADLALIDAEFQRRGLCPFDKAS